MKKIIIASGIIDMPDGTEARADVRGIYYHEPGRYSGPPEDCYPDESYTEITDVEIGGVKQFWDFLPDSVIEQAQKLIDENGEILGE